MSRNEHVCGWQPSSSHELSTRLHEKLKLEAIHYSGAQLPIIDTPTEPLQSVEASSLNELDPRPALLHFMIEATPRSTIVQDILADYDSLISRISVSRTDGPELKGPVVLMLHDVPDAVAPVHAHLAYMQIPSEDGESTELVLVWKFEVEIQRNWYEAAVAVSAPHCIVSVVDWTSDSPELPSYAAESSLVIAPSKFATYNVIKFGVNDPSEGNWTVESELFDYMASPLGWHSLPSSNSTSRCLDSTSTKVGRLWTTTSTWGNNVFAQENWDGNGEGDWCHYRRPDAGAEKVFDYKYDPKATETIDAEAEIRKYLNASVTQLFYTANMVHDLFYHYGFTEVAGNFQQSNFQRGGADNDAVIMYAQSGFDINNSEFATPPDGRNGRCRIALWHKTIPFRDGAFDTGNVIHELTHGLSTRLTGGPGNSGCLPMSEGAGLGEGWSDFIATVVRARRNASDYSLGSWLVDNSAGIRDLPYSLDDNINPVKFSTLNSWQYQEVHKVGEVWAEILWVTLHELVKVHGWSDTLLPPATPRNATTLESEFYRVRVDDGGRRLLIPKHGNTLMVKLVIDAMKLQPCRPDFLDARKAIIHADECLTNGQNACALWRGFAKRGLGPNAASTGKKTSFGRVKRTDDFDVPVACRT
ncbi:hypothetical protein HGRIS_003015 [Hohenbuehelia grisea]